MSDPWRPMTTRAFSKLLYDTSAGCSQPLAVAEHRILREEYEKLSARAKELEGRETRASGAIKAAVRGAARTERARVARYIRDVGENECGMSQLDCDLLAERIEQRLHLPKREEPAPTATGAAG